MTNKHSHPTLEQLHSILRAFDLDNCTITPLPGGNINLTYRIEQPSAYALSKPSADTGPNHSNESNKTAQQWVLQRLNPIFAPQVHHDIDIITRHLSDRGATTYRLLPTRDGSLWHQTNDNQTWRLMTLIPGITHMHATSPAMCYQAGLLLGEFHSHLAHLSHQFIAPRRPGVHDTARHIAHLKHVLTTHQHHPAFADVHALAQQLLTHVATLHLPSNLPDRIVHGDPKLANFLFAPDGSAVALIDLDTLGTMSLPIELGDALRSWCNPAGEDGATCEFALEWFEQSLRGYHRSAGHLLTPSEIAAIPIAIPLIMLELAIRFAADALAESYFGWDNRRFPNASTHHLVRANGQWQLYQSYARQRSQIHSIMRDIFE